MPQLDYDYEQAYSYESSGNNSLKSSYQRASYNYSENTRRTSEKTKSQVFMLMNDNLAYSPRYKSISEYSVPQETRKRSNYNQDIDLIFNRPKVTFDYDAVVSKKGLSNIKDQPEEVELEEAIDENEERKQSWHEERSKAFKVVKITLLLVLSFVVCAFICYRYSIINEKFNQVEKAKKQLANIQTVNEQIQADIDSKTDFSYIESYAKYQLGMQKPQDSQTIYVNSQKTDRVIKPIKMAEETSEKSPLDGIIEKISSMF